MYGKFFASTFTGSMYGAGVDVFAVWAYVIANTVNSRVELNSIMLAGVLGTTPDKVESAIVMLCSPDEKSRSHEHGGCRLIREGQFQYQVVNHGIYRAIRNEEDRKAYNREKQRESRARKIVNTAVIDSQSLSTMSAYTEAEAEAEANTKPKPKPKPKHNPSVESPKNPASSTWEDVQAIFLHWRTVLHHPGSKLTPERQRSIKKALQTYSAAECCQAIAGCSKTPHNMGENDRGEKYDDIALILRDASHIERFIRNAESPPTASPQKLSPMQRAAAALKKAFPENFSPEWVPDEKRDEQ